MHPHRRRFIRLGSLAVVPVAAAAFGTHALAIGTGSLSIGLEAVTNVGGAPLELTHAGDGGARLFIAGQSTGDVSIFKNNALQGTAFLDINGTLATGGAGLTLTTTGERGLLGIAFHPNYAAAPATPGRGKFYTYTSEPKGGSITGVDYIHDELDGSNLGDHDSVIREWTVSAANPDRIDLSAGANSSREILRIRQPQANHNGGAMRFSPVDGYMYIALGDGGGGGDHDNGSDINDPDDGHTSPPVATGNAQDITAYALHRNENVLGKMLRINPLQPDAADPNKSVNGKYSIPADNPFVGAAGADEIYAYGLRNPFRFSFDRGGSGTPAGKLYVGDVGQASSEEVDIIQKGKNYGWVYKEGTVTVNTPPAGFTSEAPLAEYGHADGVAIIGGYIYRGNNIPELAGKYVFGDLALSGAGRIFYMDAGGGTINAFGYMLNAPASDIHSFGEDAEGELYVLFGNGDVRRILGRQWMTNGGGSWNTTTNWLLDTGEGVPNAAGAAANFLGRLITPASASVTLDGSKTVGTLRFNNPSHSYIIAAGSGGTLTINGGASAGLVTVIRGTHTVSAPMTIASNTTVDLESGTTLSLTSALSLSGGVTLTRSGGGRLNLPSFNGSGATFTVTGGTTALTAGGGVSRSAGLTISSGKLDLSNNKLIVNGGGVGSWTGSAYTGLTGLIRSGRNGGNWSGATGIVTSQSAATSSTLTSIGVATASQVKGVASTATAVWAGQTVTGSNALVMYTYAGDANLDGKINVDDYGHIDSSIPLGIAGWFNGDFNYDGKLNVDDYGIIDFNIGIQGPPFSTSASAASLASVPEPALFSVLSLTPLALRRRRYARITPRWTST